MGCARKETVETYGDGQRKLVREYSWYGPQDSLHLRKEIAYYFNGRIESETHFLKGRVHGQFKAYWQNGQLKAKGGYADNRPEGKWEYYFNAFTHAADGQYQNGLREGRWTEYWENGELRRRGKYHRGKEVKEWVSWNSAGVEVLRNSCFESNRKGRFKSDYDNGSLKEEYKCRYGKRIGAYVENYPEGTPKTRGFYDTSGVQDSLWQWFHSDNRPAARKFFRHGLWNDSVLTWDSTGYASEKGLFHLGTGTLTRYDSKGHVLQIKSFRYGIPVTLKYLHANGKSSVEGAYQDGKKSGLWKIWDAQGRLKESQEYLGGEFHGERLFFDSTGAVIRSQKYFHGIPTVGTFPKLQQKR